MLFKLPPMFESCLYFNSNALARTVAKIWTDAYRRFDLSPPHAFLLRAVLAKPGLLAMDLAEELALSRSTVTRFLDSLEKNGFIERVSTKVDGREVSIYPTEQAKAIHQSLDETGAQLTKAMQELFGQDELGEVVGKLRSMQSKLMNR